MGGGVVVAGVGVKWSRVGWSAGLGWDAFVWSVLEMEQSVLLWGWCGMAFGTVMWDSLGLSEVADMQQSRASKCGGNATKPRH